MQCKSLKISQLLQKPHQGDQLIHWRYIKSLFAIAKLSFSSDSRI